MSNRHRNLSAGGIYRHVLLAPFFLFAACNNAAEQEAQKLCEAAMGLESASPRKSLEMMRRIDREMPTAGTAAAAACVRPL